jgi:hypothetical protein
MSLLLLCAGALEAQVCGEEQLVAIMHKGLAARTVAGESPWLSGLSS